jgi:hypothetical protein
VPNPERSSRPEDRSSDPEAFGGRSPILVTGVHRSGTNWMASSLRASGEVIYISEPLNILQSPSFFEFSLENWYTYINEANEGRFLESYRAAFRFHLETVSEIRRLRSFEGSVRLGKRWLKFLIGRVQSRRPLVRDPFAVFSAPWFVRRLGCRVVVIVRHPAAFVSSLKKLGWTFDFRHLLRQPALMDDRLAMFRGEMEAALRAPDDVVRQASLLWRVVYRNVDDYRAVPGLHVVRHEDLSLDPLREYASLYETLGLSFTNDAKRAIARLTSEDNPEEVTLAKPYSVRLDSRSNLEHWKRRLERAEIDRVRDLTFDVAPSYYSDDDWAL